MDYINKVNLAEIIATVLEELSLAGFVETDSYDAHNHNDERKFLVVVGLVGTYKGRLVLEAGHDTVEAITQCMNFGEAVVGLMDQALYMAELANMLGGKYITVLNNSESGLELRLTPPAVFTGTGLTVSTPKLRGRKINLQAAEARLSIEICLEGV